VDNLTYFRHLTIAATAALAADHERPSEIAERAVNLARAVYIAEAAVDFAKLQQAAAALRELPE